MNTTVQVGDAAPLAGLIHQGEMDSTDLSGGLHVEKVGPGRHRTATWTILLDGRVLNLLGRQITFDDHGRPHRGEVLDVCHEGGSPDGAQGERTVIEVVTHDGY